MMLNNKRIFLYIILIAFIIHIQNTVDAYTCTFINKTHARLTIKFYHDSGQSDDLVVPPMEQAPSAITWNAGKLPIIGIPWSVKGLKIFNMEFTGKEIVKEGRETTTNQEIKDYWSVSRPYNPTWELTEALLGEPGQVVDKVQFTLYRKPGGIGGSTYPGGIQWTSAIISLK